MARKSIRFLRGKSEDGIVRLYIERGSLLYDNNGDRLHFRIYRKKEDAFEQGNDYYEYFDSIDFKDAELIYDGPLDKEESYYFIYTDRNVKPLDTYAYWVAYKDDTIPAGPVGITVRHPDVWWTFERINQEMEKIHSLYRGPKSLEPYGYSTRKKVLKGLVLGNKERCIALIGAVHAGESGPELFLRAAEYIVKNRPDLLEKTGLAILPSVNADCREDMATGTPQYLRCNPNGVDLNRNFDANWDTVDLMYGLNTTIHGSITYRGPFPESEDETKAVVNFLHKVRPRAVFCGHCLSSICGDCFLTSKDSANDTAYKDECMKPVTAYSAGFRDVEKEGTLLRYGTTAGSVPAYVYKKFGIPAFDMEYRTVKDDKKERACVIGKTTPELLNEYTEYHTKGIMNVMEVL
jgi:hypothetical protein